MNTENPIIKDMAFNVVRQIDTGQFTLANEHGFGQMGSWRSIVAADHNATVSWTSSSARRAPAATAAE